MLRSNSVIALNPRFGDVIVKAYFKKLGCNREPVVLKRAETFSANSHSERANGTAHKFHATNHGNTNSKSTTSSVKRQEELEHQKISSTVTVQSQREGLHELKELPSTGTVKNSSAADPYQNEEFLGDRVFSTAVTNVGDDPYAGFENGVSNKGGRRLLISFLREEAAAEAKASDYENDPNCVLFLKTRNAKFGGSRRLDYKPQRKNWTNKSGVLRSRLVSSLHKLRDKYVHVMHAVVGEST